MGAYAETRSWLCRRAIGLEGTTDPREAWRLVEWLDYAVEVRQRPGETPHCILRRDGGARIFLPVLRDERQEGLLLLHELGHWFDEAGWPSAPFHLTVGAVAVKSETNADRFAHSFVAPWEVIRDLRRGHLESADVIEASGLTWEHLSRRSEDCRDWRPPRRPPGWCAEGHFQAERWRTPFVDLLELRDRSGWRAFLPGNTAGLETDFLALRPEEIRLKYGRHAPTRESCYFNSAAVLAA